jgi:hypothetical protein
MSFVRLDSQIYYGIHPSIVFPAFQVDHFIDLTLAHEVDVFDCFDSSFVRFPIVDRKAPSCSLLQDIVDYINALPHDETVYISCLGGHGRSGCVAAAYYGYKYNLCGKEALNFVGYAWNEQRDKTLLRPKTIKLGSPQTVAQKRVVCSFLDAKRK